MKTAADPTRHAAERASAHHVADEHATGAAAFTDHRPEARAQQRLQALADRSPQAVAQRKLQQTIDQSPRVTAQRMGLTPGTPENHRGVIQCANGNGATVPHYQKRHKKLNPKQQEQRRKLFERRQRKVEARWKKMKEEEARKKAKEQAQTRAEEKRRQERDDEVKSFRGTGLVERGKKDLYKTRYDLDENIAPLFSMETASSLHNKRTGMVAEDLLGRMMRNAGRASTSSINQSRINIGSDPLLPTQLPDSESAKLRVGYHAGQSPHYNQNTNSISLMNKGRLDQAGHELQHGYDHIRGNLDLHKPLHRLASEQRAFTQQQNVWLEAKKTHTRPPEFEGRTPEQMAKTYEGKVDKGYPGTLEESKEAVERWKRERS